MFQRVPREKKHKDGLYRDISFQVCQINENLDINQTLSSFILDFLTPVASHYRVQTWKAINRMLSIPDRQTRKITANEIFQSIVRSQKIAKL